LKFIATGQRSPTVCNAPIFRVVSSLGASVSLGRSLQTQGDLFGGLYEQRDPLPIKQGRERGHLSVTDAPRFVISSSLSVMLG
jgi:hypothetical protein